MTAHSQYRAIHALRRRLALEDADYRAVLEGETGKRSAKDLTTQEANRVVVKLKALAGQGNNAAAASHRSAAATASGRFAPILQALWIAGWNLGVVRSKDDAAMLAFVARQSGIGHTRFLVDPVDARKAIEALKDWLAREAGVAWPVGKDDGFARKIAVCQAIALRLQKEGGFTPFIAGESIWPRDIEPYGHSIGLPVSFEYYEGADWDRLANKLGARLRATMAKNRKGLPSIAA